MHIVVATIFAKMNNIIDSADQVDCMECMPGYSEDQVDCMECTYAWIF